MADDAAPRPIPTLVPFQLYAAGRLIERELTDRLGALGLTMRLVGILGHLTRSPALSYSELARRADVSVQSMHGSIRPLIAEGIVEGVGTAGQAAQLSITTAGRATLERAQAVIAAYEDELLEAAGMPAEELRAAARSTLLAAWRASGGGPDLPGPPPQPPSTA